ncbi:MAG: hypothetical protein JWR75_1035 [Devosia sp.]|nr:hypothetical protein [Devosia sp.]
MTAWEIHGSQFTNCSCAYGCPCQFNALPTKGYCQGLTFARIDTGHFGSTRLDGLNLGLAIAWPGAVHEGRGAMQPVVDERGDAGQREAMLSIITGKETDPMATFFAIYTATCDTIHPPIATRIVIDLDIDARFASYEALGVVAGRGSPILNPITQEEYRGGIKLPNGSEFGECEVGRGWSESVGNVPIKVDDSHAHWSELHLNQHGRIH